MYLFVAEAEDGTWFDDPDTVVGLDQARQLARAKWEGRLPRGYEVLIYKVDYVECVPVAAKQVEEA